MPAAKNPDVEIDPRAIAVPPKEGRKHRATFARDKRKGGYLIRVAGPYPEMFADRIIPVTRMNGQETMEHLGSVIWTGVTPEDSKVGTPGERVALYSFEPREREVVEPDF